MNISKVSALALIIIYVASVLAFAYYGSTIKHTEDKPSNLLIWNETGIYQDSYLKVWKPFEQMTAVNQTTDTIFAYYTKGFNIETKQIQLLDAQTYIMSSEVTTVYWNESSANAIQWAMNQAGRIKIDAGNYTIDKTLQGYSNTIISGVGANLIRVGNLREVISLMEPFNFSLSDISIDNNNFRWVIP